MLAEPNCFKRRCKHFDGVKEVGGEGEEFQVVVCPAYPEGIPGEIAYGDHLHLVVREDQEGETIFEEETEVEGE